jgi:arylsulfatase A-like enzyme
VCLPKVHPSFGSAYLGAAAAPFGIDADPNAPDFTVPDVLPPVSVSAARMDNRKVLLDGIDRFQKAAEARANRDAAAMGTFREKAFDLMTSPQAKKAFELSAEPEKLRDEYGRTSLGQSGLLARRLVEAGVRCVSIDHTNWDTHDGNFATLKRDLLPALDAALATLFRDLAERGLLESTLVVVTGEFGRTPRINKNAGRDHWGPAFTVALGGGGIKGGVVVGKSDARAEKPASDPYGPEDMCATMYRLMGIDPEDEFYTPEGRPVKIVNNGRVIHELL